VHFATGDTMDFSLSDHQKLIRDTVRQFMENEVRPGVRQRDRKGGGEPPHLHVVRSAVLASRGYLTARQVLNEANDRCDDIHWNWGAVYCFCA
jgi:alkylation response protein AidB-like acyl-CoA dehydrogenase